MDPSQSFLRPHLRALVRRDSADLRGNYVRLDRNERIAPLSGQEYEKLLGYLKPSDFTLYPDPKALQDRLCQEAGVPPGWVLLANGSDNAIRRIFQATIEPQDAVGFPTPTYEMYSIYAEMFQARAFKIAYSEDRKLDVAAVLRTVRTAGLKLFCLASPDQPTGAELDKDALARIARGCLEAGTLFLIDEAYWVRGRYSAVELAKELPNTIVVRSFSKVIGFGGVRLGAIYAHPSLVDLAVRVKGLHEVNSIALAVGAFTLDHPEVVESYFAQTEEGRQRLVDGCKSLEIAFPECPPMFQLLEFKSAETAGLVAAKLKDKGWLVRGGFSASCLKACLRVSLAGPDTMDAFCGSLAQAMGELQ